MIINQLNSDNSKAKALGLRQLELELESHHRDPHPTSHNSSSVTRVTLHLVEQHYCTVCVMRVSHLLTIGSGK
jgi:hypothetical protein